MDKEYPGATTRPTDTGTPSSGTSRSNLVELLQELRDRASQLYISSLAHLNAAMGEELSAEPALIEAVLRYEPIEDVLHDRPVDEVRCEVLADEVAEATRELARFDGVDTTCSICDAPRLILVEGGVATLCGHLVAEWVEIDGEYRGLTVPMEMWNADLSEVCGPLSASMEQLWDKMPPDENERSVWLDHRSASSPLREALLESSAVGSSSADAAVALISRQLFLAIPGARLSNEDIYGLGGGPGYSAYPTYVWAEAPDSVLRRFEVDVKDVISEAQRLLGSE